MRIIFIGCVKSSYVFLQAVLNSSTIKVVGIVTKEKSDFNADFCSLEEVAIQCNIPVFMADHHTQAEMTRWCSNFQADMIYCLGWSNLLPKEILRLVPKGVVGYHPAAIPQNRGRHPIIWALALGLVKTASTFFFIDDQADHGKILSQIDVEIDVTDDAASLYTKLLHVAQQQIKDLSIALANNAYVAIEQDHSQANYWRKRTKKDGLIDWRMSAKGIYNLIRALGHPYVGAHFEHEGKEIKVWRSKIICIETQQRNLEPGRILEVCQDGVIVQCGEGVIKLLDYDDGENFLKGACLL